MEDSRSATRCQMFPLMHRRQSEHSLLTNNDIEHPPIIYIISGIEHTFKVGSYKVSRTHKYSKFVSVIIIKTMKTYRYHGFWGDHVLPYRLWYCPLTYHEGVCFDLGGKNNGLATGQYIPVKYTLDLQRP